MKPIFVNTRPQSRQNLLAKVTDFAQVIHLPLLELLAKPLNDDELTYQKNLIKGDYDILVVVSITAVDCARQTLSENDINRLHVLNKTGKLTVVAVGQPTAKALAELGITAILPPVASNESMSRMTVFHDAKKVLFWRGVGGRVLLLDYLKEQGVAVDKVDFYQRIIPDGIGERAMNLSRQATPKIILITSEMAWQAWQMAMDEKSIDLADFDYVAMGDRLYTMIRDATDKEPLVVYELHDNALVEAITQWKRQ